MELHIEYDDYKVDKVEPWTTQARHFLRHLNDCHIPAINVRPAYTGGWKKGYTWRGTFVITFAPSTTWINPHVSERHTNEYRIKSDKVVDYGDAGKAFDYSGLTHKVERYWNKIKGEIQLVDTGLMIVGMYRRSGLIPKDVAKRHQTIINNKFGKAKDAHGREYTEYYTNRELISYLGNLMSNYIEKHAKCPDCGNKGFTENILGFECNHCGGYLDDTGEPKWVSNSTVEPLETFCEDDNRIAREMGLSKSVIDAVANSVPVML